jgi:hypothetical protein
MARSGLRGHLGGGVCLPFEGEAGPLRGQLVELRGEPLGQLAGVDEDDRRPVLLDEVEHPLLDVWPDGTGLAVLIVPGGGYLGHVLHRDGDPYLDHLRGRRLHHGDRPAPGQEGRHLLHRPDRRRQPDALRRTLQQRVQPLERKGEM